MKPYLDRGLVLRRTAHKESDNRLVVLLKESGKLYLVTKGTVRPTAKLKSLLEPFSEIDVQFFLAHQTSHGRLVSGKLISSFQGIRTSYPAYVVACAMVETVDLLVPFRAPSPDVFDILRESLDQLCSSPGAGEIWIHFVLKLLESLGHGDLTVQVLHNRNVNHQLDQVEAELNLHLPWKLKTDLNFLKEKLTEPIS